MKKMILLLLIGFALSLTATTAHAQSATVMPTILGDSLVNTDTVFKKISVTAGYSKLGIQADVKKGTGTLTGKMYIYASMNGSAFTLVDSASYASIPTFSTALVSTTTFTNTAYKELTVPAGTKYLVACTSSATLASSPVVVSYTLRKHD